MELGLSLGDSPRGLGLADAGRDLGLSLALGSAKIRHTNRDGEREIEAQIALPSTTTTTTTGEPPVHLSLLPLNFSWPPATQNRNLQVSMRGFDVNRAPSAEELEEGAALSSSPNSAVSSFQMDFSARRGAAATTSGGGSAGNGDPERKAGDGSHSRASDEDETGSSRKKLRLSKEQSAFLEESFKEHNTLNPKQKLALAKQLNLRPRQVEVWFQNRRARTKLKQTEVDCEYLKRCCETLTEENRRLQKELAELRALKTAHPFYMHLPATTLSMCPSCERVASSSTSSSSVVGTASNTASTSAAAATASDHRPNSFAALFNRPRSGFPFSGPPQQQPPASS